MRLDEGWNQIQFNLSDFTRRAYGKFSLSTLTHFYVIYVRHTLWDDSLSPSHNAGAAP